MVKKIKELTNKEQDILSKEMAILLDWLDSFEGAVEEENKE